MATVIFGMSMSLDGYVANRDGDLAPLYPDFEEMHDSPDMHEAVAKTRAVVMGRRTYEMGNGDYTDYEFQVPIFVVTHRPPTSGPEGENEQLTFTFVPEGVEHAVASAWDAAGDGWVTIVGGPSVGWQALAAGLVDQLHVDVIPVLLGGGLRLFDAAPRVGLEKFLVTEFGQRTSIRFRVTR